MPNPTKQSKPLWLKQLAVSLHGQARCVERQSHCSNLIEQYTGLKLRYWWQFGTLDKPDTTLFQQYRPTIQSACHMHTILVVSTILDFWTLTFKATVISTFVVHFLWKFTKLLKTCWKCCVQFCGILACSFEIMPH